jgi:LPXTG-motif cell wall-anchored protein
MKRILITAVLVGALVEAGLASAGCWSTVGLAPPPAGIAPGTTWTAELTVLQHGVNALPNAGTARPTVTIINTDTGARKTFTGHGTKDPEVFVADVVFPTAGTWRYEVYDDFTSDGVQPVPCAQTHSFAAVTVGGPAGGGTPPGPPPAEPVATSASTGDGFPVWPVVAGAFAALALAAGLVLLRRRPTRESVA